MQRGPWADAPVLPPPILPPLWTEAAAAGDQSRKANVPDCGSPLLQWPARPRLLDCSTLTSTPVEITVHAGAAGLVVAFGNFSGAQISTAQDKGAVWYPLISGMHVPNQSPLWARLDPLISTPTGICALAYYPVKDPHDVLTLLAISSIARGFGGAGNGGPIAVPNPAAAPKQTVTIEGSKFASVVAGAQITDATYLLAGGTTVPMVVTIYGDGNNNKQMFISTNGQAEAAELDESPVGPAAAREFVVPVGGKLWQAAADALQVGYFDVTLS